ncbi:hypothetical protein ACRQ1B_28195 [Rhizobium panacihumi]|uniref:hypothetical protein n=1 Tax=Rhizobium panacihumi TaxID=2008450 RepID=UPI003D7A0B17
MIEADMDWKSVLAQAIAWLKATVASSLFILAVWAFTYTALFKPNDIQLGAFSIFMKASFDKAETRPSRAPEAPEH